MPCLKFQPMLVGPLQLLAAKTHAHTHTHTHTHRSHVRSTGLTRRLDSRPRMARSSFWTTLRTCMSQHSCLPAQPVLAPAPPAGGQFLRLGPWLFFAAWPSDPQGLQLFSASASQNSSLRLRTCPSARLGVALALGVFQALALVGAAIPLTFALLAPSLCSQALSH